MAEFEFVITTAAQLLTSLMLVVFMLYGINSHQPVDGFEIAQPQKSPSFAASGPNVYVVWYDNVSEKGSILFSKSLDGGISFSNPKKILDGAVANLPITLGATGDNLYLVWNDPNKLPHDIFFMRSSNAGDTFEPAINLSNDLAFSNSPQLALSGNNVYVLWASGNTLGNSILLGASADDGKTFGQTTTLATGEVSSQQVRLAAIEDSVYAAWVQLSDVQHDIGFATSNDNGKNFNKLSLGNASMHNFGPEIYITRNAVYLTYYEWHGEEADYPNSSKVILQRSMDKGMTFNQPLQVSGDEAGLFSEVPQVIAAPSSANTGDDVYLIWRDALSNKTEVSLRISNDIGKSFGDIVTLSNITSAYPHAAISILQADDVLLVAWGNSIEYGRWDIFLASINELGDVLSISKVSDSGYTSDPRLVATGNSTVYLFWTDGKYDQERNDIFFSRINTNVITKESEVGPVTRISVSQSEGGSQQGPNTTLLQKCQELGISDEDCSQQMILQKESEPEIQQPEDWSAIYKGLFGWMPFIFGIGAAVAGIIAFMTLRKRTR